MNQPVPMLQAGLDLSQAPTPDLQAHQVHAFGNDQSLRASHSHAGAMQSLADKVINMQDYKTRVDSITACRDIQQRSEEEAERRTKLAPGHPESFYFADGSIRQDQLDEYTTRYSEEFAAVNPRFSSRQLDIAWQQDRGEFVQNSVTRLAGRAVSKELDAIERSSGAIIADAMEKGDYSAVVNESRRQVKAGILMEGEAAALQQKASRRFTARAMRQRNGFDNVRDRLDALSAAGDTSPDIPAQEAGDSFLEESPTLDFTLAANENLYNPLALGPEESLTLHVMGVAESIKPDLDSSSYSPRANESQEEAYALMLNNGDPTLASYREGCGRIARYYVTSSDYAGLSDKELKDTMEAAMNVQGINEKLDIDEAMRVSETNRIISNALSTRGGRLKSTDRARDGADGLSGIDGILENEYQDYEFVGRWSDVQESYALKSPDSKWVPWNYNYAAGWNPFSDTPGFDESVEWTARHEKLKEEFTQYRTQFNYETGRKDEDIDVETFSDWFFKKDGVWETRRKARVESMKGLVRMKAEEAVIQYRLDVAEGRGDYSWAEERILIQNIIRSAVSEVQGMGDDAYTLYMKERDRHTSEQARQYQKEAKPALQSFSAAQLEEKEAKEQKERYKKPVTAKLTYDRHAPREDKEAYITIPMAQYVEVCRAHGLTEDDGRGIVATVGNGRTPIAVKPYNGDKVLISPALFTRLTPDGLSTSSLEKRLQGFNTKLKFTAL